MTKKIKDNAISVQSLTKDCIQKIQSLDDCPPITKKPSLKLSNDRNNLSNKIILQLERYDEYNCFMYDYYDEIMDNLLEEYNEVVLFTCLKNNPLYNYENIKDELGYMPDTRDCVKFISFKYFFVETLEE
jgi:hypothetical protein